MNYKTTIQEIFSNEKNLFAVPNYQRAYSWEADKHVQQFLTDLFEHPNTLSQYHLGHFLFERDETNYDKYWIIDGQQRLTTVVIFLSCVQKKLSTIIGFEYEMKNLLEKYLTSNNGKQKFKTVGYDNNFFVNTVIEAREDKIDTRSRKRIKEAFDLITKSLVDVPVEKLIHWIKVIETAKITTDIVQDKAEATQIFSFQNDRGKLLTNLERLKAFLMLQIFLACKAGELDSNEAITFVENEFETIYKAMEKIEIATEDQVLNFHCHAFIGGDGSALDKVKRFIRTQDASDLQKRIKDFAVSLKRSFEFSILVQAKRTTKSHIADVLFLDPTNAFPLLLKLYHFNIEETLVEKMVKLVEITLFRLTYTTGKFQTNSFNSVALNFKGDTEQLKTALLYHSRQGFQWYWNFEGSFHAYLNGDNHYTSLTRYLLWKHENSLRNEVKEPPMLFPEFNNLYGTQRFENTIDHWTPQKPVEIEYDKEFNDKYLHNIGNMVLSTRGRNASDNNSLPGDRSTISTLISRQKLESYKNSWDKEQIKSRQDEIVTFAKKYWNPENVFN